MDIHASLLRALPDICGKLAGMADISDRACLNSVRTITEVKEFKEWLQPIGVSLEKCYGLSLSLRTQTKEEVAEAKELSLVLLNQKGQELCTLMLTKDGLGFLSVGLLLNPGKDHATRYDPYALSRHILENNFSAFFVLQVLHNLGEPLTIRAKSVWAGALIVLDQALKEQSPERKTYEANVQLFYRFIGQVYGDISAVSQHIVHERNQVYDEQNRCISESPGILFQDDVLALAVSEGGIILCLGFADISLQEDINKFCPSDIRPSIRKKGGRAAYYVEIVLKALQAFKIFTKQEMLYAQKAEDLRRRILRMLRSMDTM